MSPELQTLFDYLEQAHPGNLRGVTEARAMDPELFDRVFGQMLRWARLAWGQDILPSLLDAFVRFTYEINVAQARYEAEGHYAHQSFMEVFETIYANREVMDAYLHGDYFTNLLWAHHVPILALFEQFLGRLGGIERVVEIAPGHGFWGLWALGSLPRARLQAWDVSPSSASIARELAKAAGLADRSQHLCADALDLALHPAGGADLVISCFLLEHLEQPARLFEVMHHLLAPRGLAFVTGALSAAAEDHIHEFQRESELVLLAEEAGFRVLSTLSSCPARTLPRARYLPRSMALTLQKSAAAHPARRAGLA